MLQAKKSIEVTRLRLRIFSVCISSIFYFCIFVTARKDFTEKKI